MDAAALSLKIDSSDLPKATAALDKFSSSSDRAAASVASGAGKISSGLSRSAQSAVDAASSIDKYAGSNVVSINKLTNATHGNSIAMRESIVVAREFFSGNYTRLPGSLSILAQQFAISGKSATAFGSQILQAFGLISRTGDAALDGVAARAAGTAAAIAGNLRNAEAAAINAGADIELAAAQARAATTAAEQAAASTLLTAAIRAEIAAVAEAALATDALANANLAVAETAAEASAAESTALAPLGIALVAIVAVVGSFAAGLAALTSQANDDSGLKKFTAGMGYSKDEVKKLNDVTVSFGDTFKAVFQVGFERIASAFGMSAGDMKKAWTTFLDFLATATRATIAGIYAGFATLSLVTNPVALAQAVVKGKGNPFKPAYDDAQKYMDDVVKQARTNAQKRQSDMAKAMYDAPKERKAAHKFDFTDILKDAQKQQDSLTKAGAQIGHYGEDLARITYEQDLLNKATEHHLVLTPQQTAKIKELAAAMAAMSEDNRHAKFMEDFNQQTITQVQSLETARGAIGLTGAALAEYTYKQQQLNKAIADHITLSDADKEKINDDARTIGVNTYQNIKESAGSDRDKAHNEAMRQLKQEQGALGLTGAAALSYAYAQQEINREHAAGVDFADMDIKMIDRQAKAYGDSKYAIDQQAKAIADAREVTKGFWTDFVNGARQGENVFTAFASAVTNALNKIIDKLLDKGLDSMLDKLFTGSGGGGLFSSIFGGKTTTTAASDGPTFGGGSQGNPSGVLSFAALGGIYGAAQRFANGGAFTNSVVTAPTLFRFANGGKIGEMGEAGPEAIMPLKRGPNGALGVQMHGGGQPSVRMGDYNPSFSFAGAVGIDGIASMVRQGGEATYNQMKRDLQSLLQQLDQDGTLA